MADSQDMGGIRQQIGETLGTVRSVLDQLREIKADSLRRSDENRVEAQRQQDQLSSEIRNIKHEQRQQDQLIASKLEILGNQVRTLDDKARTLSDDVSEVRDGVKSVRGELMALKLPVDKLIELRDRLIAYVAIGVTVVGFVWVVFGPTINTFVGNLTKSIIGQK